MVEEKKELEVAEVLDKILDRTIPKSIQERVAILEQKHESPYRDHPDMVAVYEVSQGSIPNIDGTNGYHLVPTGSAKSKELGLSETAEFTEQKLLIKDRFKVVFHPVATGEWHHEYIIVSKEEWESKTSQSSVGMMLQGSQQLATLMQRADI